jgi:hypothetical protein
MSQGDFKLTETDFTRIIDSLDGTAGWCIKQMELSFWIEHFVNEDRRQRGQLLSECREAIRQVLRCGRRRRISFSVKSMLADHLRNLVKNHKGEK